MGSGSSIESRKGSIHRQPSRHIRNEMKREFGTVKDGPEKDHNFTNVSVKKGEKTDLNPAIFKARRLFMKPVIKSRPKTETLVIKRQNNAVLIKELYRRMDPSKNELSVRSIVGEIEVAAKYKLSDKYLLVKIGRAKGLVQEEMQFPNPYVLIDLYLKSNPQNTLSQQTRIKMNTCNPIFQEIIMFPVDEHRIAETNMRISIWDRQDIGEVEFLGETMIELCKLNLNSGNLFWYKLKHQTDMTVKGNLDVTLDFDASISSLAVTVHDAKNLKVADNNGATSHPFYRVYVTGIPSKQESKVVENTLDPIWDERKEFDVHADEFSRRIVIINVMSRNSNGGKSIGLGDVHIPLANILSSEWGKRETYYLQDLRSAPYVRSKWSEEGLSIEFKEAMKAHAIYGYPKFLFKEQHNGKKVVSCYSEKARTQAKMVIMNGVPTFEEVEM